MTSTDICTAVEEQPHHLGMPKLLGQLCGPPTDEVDRRRRLFPGPARAGNVKDVVRGIGIGSVFEQQLEQTRIAESSGPDKRRGEVSSLERFSLIVWRPRNEEHPLLPNQAGGDNTYVLGRIDKHNVVMTCLPG
ncbi:hypothetical protein NEMBOFW57_009486 [Staphylotrichum longicolle]|uniref:Uncharacterized protein n=1 Tax=Staphylotrichum longicolle TaxID=669026 RepID=A0AAD4EPG2_9PEZI|nr:hypothetical protein NEMBOFW57_009486 [Staphylotrichum longicolle]